MLFFCRNYASVWSFKHNQVDWRLPVISNVHCYGVSRVRGGLFIIISAARWLMSGWMSSYVTQIATPTVFVRFLQNFAHTLCSMCSYWKKLWKQIVRILILKFLENFSNFELRLITLLSSVNNLMSQNYKAKCMPRVQK